ncbi:MAG: hypothetical protein Q9174_000436 [Haloplaca sp. 1 TL-2023]
MSESDQKFTTEQEELDKILQNSVPGLVSKSQRRSGTETRRSKDGVSKGGPATHQLLAEPSVFNIATLLPPSLSFLQRLKDIVPPNSDIATSTLMSFLDDFLVNVFLPQLEESVTELCAESYMRPEAFQEDPHWHEHAAKPILKSTTNFFALVKTFCRLLDSLPEDQSFSQLVISQLITYYDKCFSWYKSMVQRTSTQVPNPADLKPAAVMVEAGDLRNILDSQWRNKDTDHGPAVRQQWLASSLQQLRQVIPEAQTYQRTSARPQQVRRWTLLDLQKTQSNDEPVHLPMTQESATRFDGIIKSMRSLALDALYTLQVDIRCGVIHMTTRLLNAPYLLPYPPNNPDPTVMSLNSDLLSSDDTLSTYLPVEEHRFLTTGLAQLIDLLLVADASRIKTMDLNGCGRMQLNILVLQQNLKAIEGDVSLSRSSHYFDLFAEGADAIVDMIKKEGAKNVDFSFEEMKHLVELCHSEGLQSAQREASVQAKKRMAEHFQLLKEYMS